MNAPPTQLRAVRSNRRRWLIAAAILTLLLLAGWSLTSKPRDPRFVGRWQPGTATTHWIMDANGDWDLITQEQTRVRTTQQWYVRRGRFYVTPKGGYWAGIASDWWNHRLKGKTPPGWSSSEVVSISGDQFVLRDPRVKNSEVIFTRILEPIDASTPETFRPLAD